MYKLYYLGTEHVADWPIVIVIAVGVKWKTFDPKKWASFNSEGI